MLRGEPMDTIVEFLTASYKEVPRRAQAQTVPLV